MCEPISEDNKPVEPSARDAQQAAALLKQLFPALFSGQPKPIMLKVQQAIEARAPGRFTKKALSTFLARHTGSTSYLLALSKAEQRFDLDGQPAGPLSDEHREAARKLLAERRERVKAREQEMEGARRWRQALLRDFEQTKLSRTNFCALKNVPESGLDALLAQAREERASLPPPPPRREGQERRDRRDGRDAGAGRERREARGPQRAGAGRPEGRGPRGPAGRGTPRPDEARRAQPMRAPEAAPSAAGPAPEAPEVPSAPHAPTKD